MTAAHLLPITTVEIGARVRGGRTVLTRLAGGDLLWPRPLPPHEASARVALVQPGASLLRGDALSITVDLGPGARLDLIEVAATIAQNVRGGSPSRVTLTARLGRGARAIWAAKPLVLCDGCDVERTVSFELEAGAELLLRDTIVLGRTGEQPGSLRTGTAVRYDGAPLHHEALDTSDRALLRSPAVAGDARVLDAVALYGARGEAPGEAVLQLEGPGSILVLVASEAADAELVAGSTFRRWQRPPD